VLSLFMAYAVAMDSVLLFPGAFVMLVVAKSYQVAKSAVVPVATPSEDSLVEANSKLQLLAGVASVVAAVPGAALLLLGPSWAMGAAAVAFGAAAVVAMRLRQIPPPVGPAVSAERAAIELKSGRVVAAAAAMAMMRAVVGFVTFLIAFEIRGGVDLTTLQKVVYSIKDLELYQRLAPSAGQITIVTGPPAWYFGFALGASVLGGLAGAALAPVLRRHFAEEAMLGVGVMVAVVVGVAGLVVSGLLQIVMLAGGVALAAAMAKQAFDSLVQREAPDADRAGAFARFESRFQVAWVMGAIVPVAIAIPLDVGAVIVTLGAITAAVVFAAPTLSARSASA
jgi:hypothetical protein